MRYEGHLSDFESFGRGEKHHVVRVMINGIDQAAFFDNGIRKPSLFCLNAAGEANGSGADDEKIKWLVHVISKLDPR